MTRLKPNDRRDQILDAAIHVAEREGYARMTRDQIADHAGVATGLVSHYFGTMPQLRRTVMRHAVIRENLIVIGQGIAAGDLHALKAPYEVKQDAMRALLR